MSVYVPLLPLKRGESGELVPVFDLTPARAYGELKVLLDKPNMMLAAVPIIQQLKRDMRTFSDDDYILPVGDPSSIAAVVMVAAQMNRNRVKILSWDRRTQQYIELQLAV